MIVSYHLLAELSECNLSTFAPTAELLKTQTSQLCGYVEEAGFTVVSETRHFFGSNAATCAICLSESHLTFHTWPEYGLVHLDILSCSYSRDPRQAMKDLLGRIASQLFYAGKINSQIVQRGAGEHSGYARSII